MIVHLHVQFHLDYTGGASFILSCTQTLDVPNYIKGQFCEKIESRMERMIVDVTELNIALIHIVVKIVFTLTLPHSWSLCCLLSCDYWCLSPDPPSLTRLAHSAVAGVTAVDKQGKCFLSASQLLVLVRRPAGWLGAGAHSTTGVTLRLQLNE